MDEHINPLDVLVQALEQFWIECGGEYELAPDFMDKVAEYKKMCAEVYVDPGDARFSTLVYATYEVLVECLIATKIDGLELRLKDGVLHLLTRKDRHDRGWVVDNDLGGEDM